MNDKVAYNRTRVLMVAPSLEVSKNVSGVSAVANFIIAHNETYIYEHFLQGRSDDEKGVLKRIARLLKNYKNWKQLLKNRNDIIIHYNFPLDAPSILRDYYFIKAAHRMGKRMVIHIHGGLYLFKEKKPFPIHWLLHQIFGWNHPFIVLSNKEREHIIQSYPAKHVEVLPNCVDIPPLSVAFSSISTLHLLFMGRIEPNKGMDYLYSAMEELQAKDFVLHFAGIEQGSNGYVSRFQQLLGNKFVYEGVVSGERKTELLRRCQVFLLPSLYEGLPVSLLEAMSFGQVPVVSNVGSIGEYVENGKNGLLLKPQDISSISEALSRIYNDRKSLQRMSAAARQTVCSRLNPYHYIERLNLIYAQTL